MKRKTGLFILVFIFLFLIISLEVAAVQPTISRIRPNAGTHTTLRNGQIAYINVSFDQVVTVTGSPRLELIVAIDTNRRANATYNLGTGFADLLFVYTLGNVENSDPVNTSRAVNPVNLFPLQLNGGTIKNAGLENAILNMPNPPNDLASATPFLIFDNIAPTVSWATPTNVSNYSRASYNQTFNISMSELHNQSVQFSFDNASGTNFNVTVVNSSGYWAAQYNMSSLAEGAHIVTIIANDSAGNRNNTQQITFKVDFTPPTVTTSFMNVSNSTNFTRGVILINSSINDSTLTVETVKFGIETIDKAISNSSQFNVTATRSGSYWTHSLPLAAMSDGIYRITIYANDTVNNLNNSLNNLSFTVDHTPPNVTTSFMNVTNSANLTWGVIMINSSINDTTLTVETVKFGVTNDNNNSQFNLTAAKSGSSWTYSLPLAAMTDGIYRITIYANDTLNNLNNSLNNLSFTVDNTVPAVTFATIGQQNHSAINTTTLFNVSIADLTISTAANGITPGQVLFSFDNSTGTGFNLTASNMSGYWNVSYNVSALAEGIHTLTILVNDTLGNLNRTQSINFTVDKTAPSVTVSCSPSAATAGETVSCTCTGTDSLTGIKTTARFSGSDSSAESTTASGLSGTSQTCYAEDYSGNVGTGTGSWTVSAASTGGGGGGGSGGGASSGVTDQFAQEVWTSIKAGETASVKVKNGAISVTEVSFSVQDTTLGAWVKVEKTDSLPSEVQSFSGKVYSKVKITESNVQKVLAGSATIDFKVTKAWLNENGLGKTDVVMFRYAGSKWTELKTTVGEDDGTYVHYSAETPGFSYFVIGQKSAAKVSIESEALAKALAPSGEQISAEEQSGAVLSNAEEQPPALPYSWSQYKTKLFWMGVVIIILIALIVDVFMIFRKRKLMATRKSKK